MNAPDLLDRAIDHAAVELAKRGRELAELAKADDRLSSLQRVRAAAPAEPNGAADERLWNVIHGDCLTVLAAAPAKSVRLAFADPPYNIGVDYGSGASAVRRDRRRSVAAGGGAPAEVVARRAHVQARRV
jgi:hypothetical protein